ncbi:hypothetical protein Taro_000090, partial [Colocasia esculenta]|nr:hypothetical protein [Colocasia esculenta]
MPIHHAQTILRLESEKKCGGDIRAWDRANLVHIYPDRGDEQRRRPPPACLLQRGGIPRVEALLQRGGFPRGGIPKPVSSSSCRHLSLSLCSLFPLPHVAVPHQNASP